MADIVGKWEEIRALVEQIDLDIRKNARGNASAGIRARKGLRALKNWSSDLVKETVAADKARKQAKD
ncbi:MAG: hypothetical protein ACW96N_02220 [Candidatus Thorarchaeota archaeon]|jgi:hypothetical protein